MREITQLLKEEFVHLKSEITHKNMLIENRMIELYNKNNKSKLECSPSFNTSRSSTASPSSNNLNSIVTHNLNNKTSDSGNWKTVKNGNKLIPRTPDPTDITLHNIRTLITDENSDFDNEFDDNIVTKNHNNSQVNCNPIYTRRTVVVNQKPENDKLDYKNPTHVPGNSNYANLTKSGKKILILTDSICGRIRMKEFNVYVRNGYAYRKAFPGATPKELAHYCIPTLLEDKPDIVIINAGTDSLNKNDLFEIADDISNIPNSLEILKKLKLNNVNRLVIGHLNINSLRNKYEYLKTQIKGNIDILVITESKLHESFPTQQFAIKGYSLPYRGGVVIYIREDILCKELTTHPFSSDIEGIFLEVNLRKSKWLVFGGYNNNKLNTDIFLSKLGPILDHYLPKFDNFLLL